MYKRRSNKSKAGSLGIVRSSTQQNSSKLQENDASKVSINSTSVVSKRSTAKPEKTAVDGPDQVLSDSEPSPKKSRRYLSSSSFCSKDFSTSNFQEVRPTTSSAVSLVPPVDKQKIISSQQKNINKEESINKTAKSVCTPLKKTTPKKSEGNTRPLKKTKSYLHDVCQQAGLHLSDGYSANVLRTDQAIFIRDMGTLISNTKAEQEKNIEHIMKDLEEYCQNDKCFKMSLSLTETASECEVSRGATQDSFMRLLLHIDCLQTPITQLLLDNLAKYVMDDSSDDADTPTISWVRMILQCFRFLDRISSGDSLNERLLDIVLATSDVTIQQEVIIMLPDIISDNDHHYAALELSKLVRKSPQLLASALEALTNLSLQPDVKAEVQPLLMKALHKVQPEFLPAILKFLFTDSDPPLMDEIITFLRNELDLSHVEGDTASIQVMVFGTLRDVLLASRTLPAIWQKNISAVKTQAEHKPMDIIVLLILLSTTNDHVKQKSIEAVFRNKIRSDLFTQAILDETLKMYTAVVKEYFQVAIKLAGTLFKSLEPVVIDFASNMYIGMFVFLDGLWCKWVLTDLQVCVGAGDSNVARSALNTLQHLTDNYLERVKPLGIILMQLLNKLSDLVLSEVRQLMDILCHIAYYEESSSSAEHSILQDEINILIQKQLASSHLSVLRNGVVGCVMTIKHIATLTENTSEMDPDESTDKAKKAIQLLEILLSSTRNCTEAHGLALDQLSHLLLSGFTLDPSFVQKLSSLMRDTLQDAFLIATSDFLDKEDVIKSSLQFCLDDEEEGAIALNLCDLLVTEYDARQSGPMMAVSCVHPLLRLLRGLELGDLSEIDALLGCSVNMPVPDVYSEFSQLTTYQQHIALHCLFHCINWFAEVLNCFAFMIKKNEPEKVLIRLRTMVWMRGLLARCLPLTMEYTPPTCHFQVLPKPPSDKPAKKAVKRKGRKNSKKKPDTEAGDLTSNENISQLEEDESEAGAGSETDLYKYRHFFRELDIDIWLVLTQPLTLSPTPHQNGQFSSELGPNELLFVLEDYVTKLSKALTTSNKRMSLLKTTTNQNIGFDNLNKFTPLHLAKNTIKLLSCMCSFLEKTMEYTQNLMKVNDGILDSTGMFIEGSAEIKHCQGKLLKILAILFSWVGFQNQANNNLLIAGLQKVAGRVNSELLKSKTKTVLVRECIQYLAQYQERVLDLASAGTLVDAIKALAHYTDSDSATIASVCEKLLQQRWYDLKGNREKGAALNSQVGELFSNYLLHSQDQLSVVTATLDWLATETQQFSDDKDASLSTFPSFSRLNLYIILGGLLRGLERAVKQRLDGDLNAQEKLDLWSSFVHNLETIVTVMKAYDSKPNLKVFMKGCTTVLKMFLTHGMSTCTFMFKHESAAVSQILKKLQVTTRYIQTICNYVKVSKDTTLTQFLPPVRSVLEAIILRVKSIIVINNCTDAFFMGSMKNRDLKGQEIPSQEIQQEDEEDAETNQNGSDSEPERDENDEDHRSDEENEDPEENVSLLY